MKIIHEIINRGKGSYGLGENQLTRDELLRIYDETRSITSLILTTSGTTGPATFNQTTGVLNIPNYTQAAVSGFVPYTGATANVNLGDRQLITDAVQFNLLPTALPAVGKMKWNSDAGTMDIGMGYPDVVQQVGMETYYPPVKNQTGSTITNGTVVMATGTLGASGRILIAPAIADGSVPSRFMLGITTHDIANGEDGVVTWFGIVRGFNTVSKAPVGETWVDGDVLWINPAVPGGLTKVEPSAPNIKVSIALIVHAGTNGIIMVRPSLGMRLTDLHDVNAFTPATNDLLVYNSVKWEAASRESVILNTPLTGYTVGANTALADTDSILSAFGKVQGQINARISGTIASGQVAFGTGVNTVGGDSDFVWDSVNNRLRINTTDTGANLSIANSLNVLNASVLFRCAVGADFAAIGTSTAHPLILRTNLIERINIGATGTIIMSSTAFGINATPTNTLDVAGTARIRTISNLGTAATSVLVPSATGVVSLRTASELLADMGGISGTIASGQVAFGTGANTVGGDSGLQWNNTTKILTVTDSNGSVRYRGNQIQFLRDGDNYITANSGASSQLYFETAGILRWRITQVGLLFANGPQSILTSTGNLTIGTNGGNGNILLTPNGTGLVMIGSGTPTNLLDVNGTARIRTISNLGTAATSVLVPSATGVISLRTVSELLADGSAITGAIASGQVAFGTGVNTVGGSNNLFWDNANARLRINTTDTGANLSISSSLNILNSTVLLRCAVGGDFAAIGTSTAHSLAIRTNLSDRITISSTGVINFLSNSIGIGTSLPTTTLDLNGNFRIRIISNLGTAATSVLVPSATGVISLRTVSELLADGSAITGAIASGQVAFGTGVNTVGGDSGFVWDNVNKRLQIGSLSAVSALQITASSIPNSFRIISTAALASNSGGGAIFSTNAHPTAADQRLGGLFFGSIVFPSAVNYNTASLTAFSAEAYTSATNLGSYLVMSTIPIGGGSLIRRLIVRENGNVAIGDITPTNTLDVNGTARIRTISNLGTAATEVMVPDATGVVSKRTRSEFLNDMLSNITGFNASATQTLRHVSGAYEWVNV